MVSCVGKVLKRKGGKLKILTPGVKRVNFWLEYSTLAGTFESYNANRVRTLFLKQIPALFQNFSRTLKFTNPFTPKIPMLILLSVCQTIIFFFLSLTDFQNSPGQEAFFQDFPVLENATTKFQDFPGFPGPVRTLCARIRGGGLLPEFVY